MLKRSSLVSYKSALRALRNLVVVGTIGTTAVFVEDQRRRIRLLRQMQTNAKLIKSSIKHRSAAIKLVRSLADEARLDEAEKTLVSALDDPAPRPALERCYTDLLGRMWRATGDLSETRALFGRLEKHFTHLPPSVTVFNQMIQSCLEDKDHVAARYYLRLMTEKYGIEPDVKTLGRFVLQHAQSRDWHTVENGFSEMYQTFGHQENYGKAFAATFNSILIQKFHEATLTTDTLQFVRTAIDRYGLVPDRYTSNLMVTECAKTSAMDVFAGWLEVAEQFGLPLDADTARCLLKRAWRHPRRSRELLEEIARIDNRLIDQNCKILVQDFITSRKWGRTLGKYLAPIDGFPSKRAPGEKLLAEMRRQVAFYRNPAAAVRLYETAYEKGIKMSQRVLAAAVLASLEANGGHGTTAAETLLRSASSSGQELHVALIPLLIRRLHDCIQWQCFEEVRRVVLGFYRLLEDKGVPIIHHLTTKAAQLLLSARRPYYALSLLREVQSLGWTTKTPFDIVLMTIYLHIYKVKHYVEGIRWVVSQVIGLCLEIDAVFFRAFQGAIRALVTWSVANLSVRKRAKNIGILRDCFIEIEMRKRTQQHTEEKRQANSVEFLARGSQVNSGHRLKVVRYPWSYLAATASKPRNKT